MKIVCLATHNFVKLIQSFFALEINQGPLLMSPSPTEQMLTDAENAGSAPGLSVALLQLGLIGHLPETPPANLRTPTRPS